MTLRLAIERGQVPGEHPLPGWTPGSSTGATWKQKLQNGSANEHRAVRGPPRNQAEREHSGSQAHRTGAPRDVVQHRTAAQLAGPPIANVSKLSACFVCIGCASANEAGWRWRKPNSNLKTSSLPGQVSTN